MRQGMESVIVMAADMRERGLAVLETKDSLPR